MKAPSNAEDVSLVAHWVEENAWPGDPVAAAARRLIAETAPSVDPTTAPVTAEDVRERIAEERIADIRARCICDRSVPAAEVEWLPGCPIHGDSAGDPGDLPARMREAAKRAFAGRPPMADGVYALDSGRNPWTALDDALAAAMSVRSENAAATAAENAQLRALLEHAEAELSARGDHETRWQTEKARADKAEANRAVAVQRAGQADADASRRIADVMDRTEAEVERLREQLRLTDIDAQNTEAERSDADDERKRLDVEVERLRAELANRDTLLDKHRETLSVVLGHRDELNGERRATLTAIYDNRIAHIREAHPARIGVGDCAICRVLTAISRSLPSRPDDPEEIRRLIETTAEEDR